MGTTREQIYLAALLHDIGKFYQRADSGSVYSSKYLKEHGREESTFCPLMPGSNKYTHKHVLWTAQFIEDFAPVFKNLLQSSHSEENLLDLAAKHHLKKEQLSKYEAIIKEADCLSSGMDRSSDEALKDAMDEQETSWDAFKKKRMIPIMETIHSEDKQREWHHLPICAMELSKQAFPKECFEEVPDYAGLWEKFKGEFKFIQANTYHAFSETFLNLLLKYTSCIPASTINFPDVSLYDHLKTTAALAVCLYDFEQEGEKENDPFLLIGADFSGIQTYIYQIVSKYAGKNLKGRSFYLRMLSDAVVRYLLEKLQLYQANVVYNSGGGFYILAPNTSFVKGQLQKAIEEIERRFFAEHRTNLFVAIDCIELSKDALMHQNGESLGLVWGKLFEKRDQKKSAKFAKTIESNYDSFFEPLLLGGETKRDTITGEEFLPNEKVISKGDLLLKEVTNKQIELGKKLRETNRIVIKSGEPLPYWKDKIQIEPAHLGFTYYFLNDDDLEKMKQQLSASADKVTVITLNGKKGNCNFVRTVDGINNIYGLEFYGGNENDAINMPTFEEMCANEHFSRMGVLRMDVDNLGHIFQSGIPGNRATLSRFAALSRSFDFFFSGYLNMIWREVEPERSFIVYSGGDDVFIVGSWDVALALAERIHTDFTAFACGNPAFSLSGGVAIIPPKFPIMKGAEESAEEEQNAKSHIVQWGNQKEEKNSISFMGMPLNWKLEYPAVKALKERMCQLLDRNIMPKSFLSKLMAHYANAEIRNHAIHNFKTYWMLTYDLSRMKERSKAELNELIDNCLKEVCDKGKGSLNGKSITTNYHALELWTFAARWAELEYRTNRKE